MHVAGGRGISIITHKPHPVQARVLSLRLQMLEAPVVDEAQLSSVLGGAVVNKGLQLWDGFVRNSIFGCYVPKQIN